MLIKAEQKYLRMGEQKVKLVARAIKNMKPRQALDYLKFTNKKAALPIYKCLKQGLSNAVNNQKIKEDNLIISAIEVSPAPILKRWRPVSRGRAHSIYKRTCHLKVFLKVKEVKNTQTLKRSNYGPKS